MVRTVECLSWIGCWTGRRPFKVAIVLVAMLCLVEIATARQAAELQMPSGQALAIMITNTLIAYNQGNLTGDYSVFRELASPQFRRANSPARLADIFRTMRDDRIDLSPIVLYPPKLLRQPLIDADGDLVLDGFYDTRPERVEFFLVFRQIDDVWRLFAIRVQTKLSEKGQGGQSARLQRSEPKRLSRASPVSSATEPVGIIVD